MNKTIKYLDAKVTVFESPSGVPFIAISDEKTEIFRIRLYPQSQSMAVGIDLEWSNDEPTYLANYTDDLHVCCGPSDTLEVSEGGTFLAFQTCESSSRSPVLSVGFRLQLPPEYAVSVAFSLEKFKALAFA